MATVGINIFKHHKKKDGTYNVKIRIIHKGEKKYIDTAHFVSDKQLNSKFAIKDPMVNRLINDTLNDYRKTISELGEKLELFNAESLKNYLIEKDQEMDFLQFCREYIQELMKEGRKGSAKTLQTVLLSLQDYFQKEKVSPLEINERMLLHYEKYLRSKRKLERLNQFGKTVNRTVKGMSDAGVHNHFRDLRILFKASMRRYNNPQIGQIRIPCSPFDTYKIVDAPLTRKRNLKIDQLIQIRDLEVIPESRAELARDLFMLSFYLCGMNAVDLYSLSEKNIRGNRVEYNRSKTESRRKDKAFISIKLIREAKPLLEKYLGKLDLRYATSENLDRALNSGMKQISAMLQIKPITFYWARHSFGNLARNECRLSKDDVALALNHIDSQHKTTDIYLEKDWRIVDDVQKAVLVLLKKKTEAGLWGGAVIQETGVKQILGMVNLEPLLT